QQLVGAGVPLPCQAAHGQHRHIHQQDKRGLVQCVVAEVGQAKTQVVGHKVQAGRCHQKGGQQPAYHPGKGAAHLPHKNRRHVASSSPVPVMGSSSLSPPVSSRKRS